MGHDSHGVIRIPEYLELIEEGKLQPGAAVTVTGTGPGTVAVDCGGGFGPPGAAAAVRAAVEVARGQGSACAITRRSGHVGRLGAWVQLAADAGMIAIASCNSPSYGHFVLPWGGRDPRLATNPLAYAVPTSGDPIVADFSTSVAPEGKLRVYRNAGLPVPDGWLLDGEGNPTNDPCAFYEPAPGMGRAGILPLGGTAGHKGFALGLLVEVLGACLAGFGPQDPDLTGNGFCVLVVDPNVFSPRGQFLEKTDELVAYVKSSRPAPGFEEVLMPGELEFRTQRRRALEGIPVDERTLSDMVRRGRELGVDVERILSGGENA
jgi:uncharacterized oxidoreductase